MNKKLLYGLLGIAVIVAVIGFIISKHTTSTPTTVANAQKVAIANRPACKADNSKALNLSASEQNAVGEAAVSFIIDVPAGTNADVHIATDNGKVVTGSTIYPGTYGRYNFTATNQGGGVWKVTSYTACK